MNWTIIAMSTFFSLRYIRKEKKKDFLHHISIPISAPCFSVLKANISPTAAEISSPKQNGIIRKIGALWKSTGARARAAGPETDYQSRQCAYSIAPGITVFNNINIAAYYYSPPDTSGGQRSRAPARAELPWYIYPLYRGRNYSRRRAKSEKSSCPRYLCTHLHSHFCPIRASARIHTLFCAYFTWDSKADMCVLDGNLYSRGQENFPGNLAMPPRISSHYLMAQLFLCG